MNGLLYKLTACVNYLKSPITLMGYGSLTKLPAPYALTYNDYTNLLETCCILEQDCLRVWA